MTVYGGDTVNDITLIANCDSMAELARGVILRSGENINVVASHTYDETMRIARRLEAGGCRMLIARGGHARRLREEDLSIPVTSIPFTGNNIASLLIEAKRDWGEFAVVGNNTLVQMSRELEKPIGARIHLYEISHWEDFEEIMARIRAAGIKAVVGGYDASRFADAAGLKTYCITTNEYEIGEAILEAKKVLAAMDRDKRWTDLFRTILDTISEGVVLIDREGRMTHINRPAKKLLNLDERTAPGAEIFGPHVRERVMNVIKTGEGVYDELTEGSDYRYTSTLVPIRAGDAVDEVVFVMQEAEYARKIEQKIRRRLANKGLVARKTFEDILGDSPEMNEAVRTAKQYAVVNSTVLITGETGTGKEMFAQSIHNYSSRCDEAFVAVNCATIPANLLESELFGYAEGAFTGAKRGGKAGLFELAHNGTIFLDEIGETSLDMQARLLRALEERQIMRIGDDRVIPVNIRVIAATNKDLKKLVEEGRFRNDFYYRLNVLSLRLPPLRSCCSDLRTMISHFVARYAAEHGREPVAFTEGGMRVFMEYPWPGNVRELKNVIERLTVTSFGVGVDERRARETLGITDAYAQPDNLGDESLISRREFELIRSVLRDAGGNKTEAARRLGISRPTLHRKLKQMEDLQL